MDRTRRIGLALAAAVTALLFACASASANTYNVNTNNSGPGSLRDAMTTVNSSPDPAGDTINVPAGTITLTSGELPAITNSSVKLTISGAGARSTTIDGNSNSRIFDLGAGTISISGVTVAHGHQSSGSGGGIYVHGTAAVTVTDSAVVTNSVNGSQGGGIYAQDSGDSLTLRRDLVIGNSGSLNGGGLDLDGGTVTVTDTTIANNSSQYEGGVDIDSGSPIVFTNDTIVSNTTTQGDVGFWTDGAPNITVTNTIIARNSTHDCDLKLAHASHVLDSDGTCVGSPPSGGNLTAADPKLGPLQNNGGPTDTVALLGGSPAINAGTNSGCTTTDQRGVTRPQGSTCDIGAFEAAVPAAVTAAASSTQTAATLNGSVNPQGLPTTFHFEYGTTTAYGSSTPAQFAGSDSASHAEAAAIAGLAPGTTYHFRIVATNDAGTSDGADMTFKTASVAVAKVSCVVPNLKGKTLEQARRLLRSHHCALGHVGRAAGHEHVRIVWQSPRAGSRHFNGKRVMVFLSGRAIGRPTPTPRFTG